MTTTRQSHMLRYVALLFLAAPLLSMSSPRIFAAEGEGEFVPWREVRRINADEHHVANVCFSPGGERLATVSSWRGGTIRVWETASGGRQLSKRFEMATVALSPEWDTILATTFHYTGGTGKETIELRKFPEGSLLRTMKVDHPRVFTFSANGRVLACGGGNGEITLWRVRDGKLLWTLSGHRRHVNTLSFSSDGRLLASGGPDGAIRTWSVADGRAVRSLPFDDAGLSLAFSRDGQLLAAGGNGRLKLWQTSDGTVLHDRWYGMCLKDLAFSSDSKVLAVCSTTDVRPSVSLRLLRVADLKEAQVLVEEMAEAICIDFSPDGKMLAAGCSDGSVRLYSAPQGK